MGPAWPLRAGGMSTFNERLANEYQNNGHEVLVVTFSLQYPSFLFPGKTQFSEDVKPENLAIEPLINSINPFSWLSTAQRIARFKPDFIVFRYWMPFMAPCLGSISRLSKVFGSKAKRIAIADNVLPHEKFPFSRLLARYILNSMDRVATMSKSVSNELNDIGFEGNSLQLRHPLYDNFGSKVNRTQAALHLGLDPDYKYFLFFGFIRHYKGLDLLLQAFSDHRLRKHKVKLIVAGEFYENPDRYYRLIREHKLADVLIMRTDFIPNEQVKYYFSVADLVTQTYHHATQSGVTQVGFQFDVPMLVTDVGGLSEIIENNKSGYVVQGNQEAIANAMFDFLENDRFQEFSLEVAQKKHEFSWPFFAKELLQ